MCQASRTLVQVLQNSGSQIVVLRFTTLSAQDSHRRNPQKKNHRKHSNIKSECVSVLTGSVPHKMAEVLLMFSALFRNRTHVPWLSATSLVNCLKKTLYDSTYFSTCNQFFCIQDCCTWIFQVEYQGHWLLRDWQTLNTKILEHKPLIDRSYHILRRLHLKFSPWLCTIFAQCSLSS